MWYAIKKYFEEYPAQEKVAKLILGLGLSVRDKKIFCGQIAIPPQGVARAAGVDRRAVTATVNTILKKKELGEVYRNLKSTPFFSEVAPAMKWGVVEIVPVNASMPNILAGISNVIGGMGISIRQCITEDPEFAEEAKLFVITENIIPPEAIPKLRRVKGVKSITIH